MTQKTHFIVIGIGAALFVGLMVANLVLVETVNIGRPSAPATPQLAQTPPVESLAESGNVDEDPAYGYEEPGEEGEWENGEEWPEEAAELDEEQAEEPKVEKVVAAKPEVPAEKPAIEKTHPQEVAAEKPEEPAKAPAEGNRVKMAVATEEQPKAEKVEEAQAEPAKPEVPVQEITSKVLSVRCSSSDKPVKQSKGGKIEYGADALVDGNLEVAWVEGVDGHGIGEWVELVLDRPYALDRIEVWNGYQKVRNDKFGDRYDINDRVKVVRVETGETASIRHRLKDAKKPQSIPLENTVSQRVRLVIESVYEAEYPDGAISEVKLFGRPAPEASDEDPNLADVEKTLKQWLTAQNDGDFSAYAALYDSSFNGTKRSKGRKYGFGAKAWLKDRKKMFRKKMTVTAHDVSVYRQGDGYRIHFLQRWASGKYADKGEKEIDVVQRNGEWKIIREEMLYSVAD